MGRNRGRSTDHAVRIIDERSTSDKSLWGVAWCGERGYTSLYKMPEGEEPLAYSRRKADCPKCSAAIGKARLAQLDALVTLEKVEPRKNNGYTAFRGAWALHINGELRGHIVMPHGWGNPWELRELADPENDRGSNYDQFGRRLSSERPSAYSNYPASNTFQNIHFSSKEMMASAAYRLFRMGQLRTVEEQRVAAEAKKKRRAEQDAQREIDRARYAAEAEALAARKAERKETALAGLADLAKRSDLTNLEAAGIQAALDIINGVSV